MANRCSQNRNIDFNACIKTVNKRQQSSSQKLCVPHFKYAFLRFVLSVSCPLNRGKAGCTYIHTYIHTYIPTYLPTYLPTYVRMYIHTYIHTYIHNYIHTYIHTYIHSYMYVYIYIYVCV